MIQDFCDICGAYIGAIEVPDDTGFLLLCRKCRPRQPSRFKQYISRFFHRWLIDPFVSGVAILWVLWIEEN